MHATSPFCVFLCLLLTPLVCAGAESPAEAEAALHLAQQRYERAQASYGDVLAAERKLLACRMSAGACSAAELLPQVDSLCRRSEEYHARNLAGGVTDKLSMNGNLINCLSLRLAVERRAGLPATETHARLRGLYEANVALAEKRCRSGQVNAAELESARRALADFLAAE